ncbi:MAG: cupin domain-containing protein [gamma proteobacterium symbiont of Bathyaustriella thionipta]|nr:cupin domain-containing protein [gamma proteobacterium symbiont of Bathyaustriella thionipta]
MTLFRAAEDDEYFFAEGCYILELCNNPLDAHVSIARARLPAGETTRWHCLQGISERYIILQGQGEVYVGDEAPLAVRKQDVVFIPAGCAQRMHNNGEQELIFLAVCSPRFVESAYRDLYSDE